MISKEYIESVIIVITSSIGDYEALELEGYSFGSYLISKKYKIGTSYLDIYNFILTQVYDLIDDGLDYTEYGYTDELIVRVIDKANELIYYYE